MNEPRSPESPTLATSGRMSGDAEEDLSFEAALKRLEEVVDRLEQGELELEAALAAFEEGVRLSTHCAGQLKAAESRLEILVREGDDWISRPFEVDGDEEGGDDAHDERSEPSGPEESE